MKAPPILGGAFKAFPAQNGLTTGGTDSRQNMQPAEASTGRTLTTAAGRRGTGRNGTEWYRPTVSTDSDRSHAPAAVRTAGAPPTSRACRGAAGLRPCLVRDADGDAQVVPVAPAP